ncbi:DUF1310 family protein [Enterococcus faecalis]
MSKKKWLVIFSVFLLIILLGVGGKIVMDKKNEAKKLQEEMMEVVKSDEAKKVLEEGLKNLDPKALTSEGIIQTYKLDYESIKHNPMGGIDGTIFVNNEDNLYVYFHLDKDNESKFSSEYVISGNSSQLGKELREGGGGE